MRSEGKNTRTHTCTQQQRYYIERGGALEDEVDETKLKRLIIWNTSKTDATNT